MASLNLDFSSVTSRGPLPEGIYDVTVAKVEQTVSKSSGNPMLKVEFDVQDPEYTGRKMWSNYVLTEQAMWKVKELFDSLGLDTSALVEMDTDELIGLSCKAKVAQREYDGNIQNEIKKTM